jgi:hypothetical protein
MLKREGPRKKKIKNPSDALKLLEKEKQTKSKTSRWSEILNIRDEIKTKKTVQRINET